MAVFVTGLPAACVWGLGRWRGNNYPTGKPQLVILIQASAPDTEVNHPVGFEGDSDHQSSSSFLSLSSLELSDTQVYEP